MHVCVYAYGMHACVCVCIEGITCFVFLQIPYKMSLNRKNESKDRSWAGLMSAQVTGWKGSGGVARENLMCFSGPKSKTLCQTGCE